jgi:hypothetical protein
MTKTKNLSREERRKVKREARRAIKEKFRALTKTERKAFRKAHRTDNVPFLTWLRQHEEEKQKNAEQ